LRKVLVSKYRRESEKLGFTPRVQL